MRKCVRNWNDELENTYWLIISFAAGRSLKTPWKDTMVIFVLCPWEAAAFASHDDGSLFREEAGDGRPVRPLGKGIVYSVYWGANCEVIKMIPCSHAEEQRHEVGGKKYLEDSGRVVSEPMAFIVRGLRQSEGFSYPSKNTVTWRCTYNQYIV